MFSNYLKVAWRNIFRNKLFSIINILGLCIGITCSLIIIIFIRYELSFDTQLQDPGLSYRVVQETKFSEGTSYWNTTAYPLAAALRNDFSEFRLVTQTSGPNPEIFRVEDAAGNSSLFEEKYVLFADPDYLNVFELTWLDGDRGTALANPSSVILTKSMAKKYFSQDVLQNKSIIGKHMMLENKEELTVTGIIEDMPGNISLKFDILRPYEFFRTHSTYKSGNWSGNYLGTTFVVLKDGQAVTEIENKIAAWKKKYLKPEDDSRIQYRLQPLKGMHNDEKYGSSPKSYLMPMKMLYAAGSVALFIIIIACANFINLATAQAAGRSKEVGIRKVMGSTTSGLVSQFLNENIILVGFTVIVSLALTQFSVGKVNEVMSLINLKLVFDWSVVVIAIALGCLIVLMACFYPSVVMASFKPLDSLRNRINTVKTGGLSLRRMLIVFQFSIVQVFIIGTLVVAVQINYFNSKDLGFSKEDPVVITSINELDRRDAFRQKLLLDPAIKEVCFSSGGPMSDNHFGTSFRLPGQGEEQGQGAEEKGVDENFLPFYKIELLAGRNFLRTEEVFNEFIVNEKVITALGWTPGEAIGQHLIINEGEATIVGVIKDFHSNSLKKEIGPCILLNSSMWLERSNIKLGQNSDLSKTLPFIEKTWKELYPGGFYRSVFLDDIIARNYIIEQFVFKGFTLFSLLTITIGCLGLYGLLSYVTIRKRKEVGIRKVLGASVVQIAGMFSKEFARLLLLTFFIATPVAYYLMGQWLQDFAYRIELSWWIIASGALLTVVIVFATISYQSIRAALTNPIDSLRSE